MEIKDLKDKTPIDTIDVKISEKSEIRSFHSGTFAKCRVSDSTGSCDMTLWNDDATAYNLGDIIRIENGWTGSFQGELQISAGKFGKITVLKKGEGGEQAAPAGDSLVDEEDMREI